MTETSEPGPFTAENLAELSELVLDAWGSGVDLDWSVPAGTLEWTCFRTADHTVDCILFYALLLASRRQGSYPPFTEMHVLPGSTPADLIDGLRAVTTMLLSVIVTADPRATAVIRHRPFAESGHPEDFAARGGLEMILHAHDVCSGLRIDFAPPQDLCHRLLVHTRDWPSPGDAQRTRSPEYSTAGAWAELLRRSGRQLP